MQYKNPVLMYGIPRLHKLFDLPQATILYSNVIHIFVEQIQKNENKTKQLNINN